MRIIWLILVAGLGTPSMGGCDRVDSPGDMAPLPPPADGASGAPLPDQSDASGSAPFDSEARADAATGDSGGGGHAGLLPGCLQLRPGALLDFGPQPVGVLTSRPVVFANCGVSTVRVASISWTEGSSADFLHDVSLLPGFETGGAPSRWTPLVLEAGEFAVLNVRFLPTSGADAHRLGKRRIRTGTLVVESDARGGTRSVAVRGSGLSDDGWSTAIRVDPGQEVIPQTLLHLDGTQSVSPYGSIVEWSWTVLPPPGDVSKFIPHDSTPTPTFEVNLAGEYLFELRVRDELGFESPTPGQFLVTVVPDEAIHIELLWHTPNDPDESDTGPNAGVDLDLHFRHQFAGGPDGCGDGDPDGWFDLPFDCFWFNQAPDWESIDPSIDDNPGLDRDDTDGGGPENLNLRFPKEGRTYGVGVHCWDDHGYGASFATVHVFFYGVRVWTVSNVELHDLDMWEVIDIDWPDGDIRWLGDDDGTPRVCPEYDNPLFD